MSKHKPWLARGYTFSLQPVWPPEFEPQPYEKPHPLCGVVKANLKKGRDATNKATGTKFYTISKFDPTRRTA